MTDTNLNGGDTASGNPLAKYLPGTGDSKFQTVEDLAKSKYEADRFIEELKKEQAELRQSLREMETNLTKAKGVDDVLAALKGLSGSGNSGYGEDGDTMPRSQSGLGNQSQSPESTAAAEARVRDMVQQLLKEKEQLTKAESNWNTIQSEFLKRHRNDPDEALVGMRATARELGMSFDEFQRTAQSNPTLVLRAAGLVTGDRGGQPLRFNGGSTAAVGGNPAEPVKNESYWKRLKDEYKAKGQLSKFYEPNVQQAMHDAVKQLGDAFFDRSGPPR